MVRKWLITSAIFTLLMTGVSIGDFIKKDNQSAQSQDVGPMLQKKDRGTNP